MQVRTSTALLTTLGAFALVVTLLPGSAQARATICDGDLGEEVVEGDVTVPREAFCSLAGTTVNGTVTIGRNADVHAEEATINGAVAVGIDADLQVRASVINGDLTGGRNAFVEMAGSALAGDVQLQRSFGLFAQDSELDGDVASSRSGLLFLLDGRVGGDVAADRRTEILAQSMRIVGDVAVTDAVYADLFDSVVTGRYTVTGATDGALVCASEIDGAAHVAGASFQVQLGGDAAFAPCAFNVFGADVEVADNQGDIKIRGNVVRGDLRCEGNDPAPVAAGNRVRGASLGQCADAESATTDDGSRAPTVAPRDRQERYADAFDRLDARRERGGRVGATP